MEPPAWSLLGFVLRWLIAPLCSEGGHRCGARRCGLIADELHRYCWLHEEAVLASVGSADRARQAQRALDAMPRAARRRLDFWVAGLHLGGMIDLTYGSPPAYLAGPGGIVTETASKTVIAASSGGFSKQA